VGIRGWVSGAVVVAWVLAAGCGGVGVGGGAWVGRRRSGVLLRTASAGKHPAQPEATQMELVELPRIWEVRRTGPGAWVPAEAWTAAAPCQPLVALPQRLEVH
jgi:hypothetical protein